jgi:hypothetical protein
MFRAILGLNLILALLAGAGSGGAALDDASYRHANRELARTTPHYPRARLLIDEAVHGVVGNVPFEAVQRIYFLAKPASQSTVIGFYRRRLGGAWRPRGWSCLVSRSRLVVVVMNPKRRRVGLLIDSRGASHCNALVGQIGELLALGYPDP